MRPCTKNFSAVRTAYGERMKKLKETSRAGATSTPSTPAADPKMLARKARMYMPIPLTRFVSKLNDRPQPTYYHDFVVSYCLDYYA